ncbi:MAG: four-carbon acid sugar kinase family protein [Proteobacteria bacterium]|nr:four-carbon acid sugar kinase family protein [Pseudomonadota bacterium]
MPERWLILADDLTGAADCAIAFARSGLPAAVIWQPAGPDEAVLAIDADSRADDPEAAAKRHRLLIEQRHRPGVGLFKKIDSTLRGQPAAELAETIRVLRERGQPAFAVVAPAFPEAGRTLEEGAVRVHGKALEETALWARDHSYDTANVVTVLTGVGLRTRHLSIETIRAGATTVEDRLRDALAGRADAVVCDAVTATDLDIVAEASLHLAEHVFWTGSAGLAQALARSRGPVSATAMEPDELTGGILFVVGSVAEASRAAAAVLAADESVHQVRIMPSVLRDGPGSADWARAQRSILGALDEGRDLLVEIAAGIDPDLTQGAALARRLAELILPAAPRIGALFVTGGETALALLDALGITGIRLIDEVEPGVPLGETRGALTVPIVTKAGAFGDERTLRRCLHHFRRRRKTENCS